MWEDFIHVFAANLLKVYRKIFLIILMVQYPIKFKSACLHVDVYLSTSQSYWNYDLCEYCGQSWLNVGHRFLSTLIKTYVFTYFLLCFFLNLRIAMVNFSMNASVRLKWKLQHINTVTFYFAWYFDAVSRCLFQTYRSNIKVVNMQMLISRHICFAMASLIAQGISKIVNVSQQRCSCISFHEVASIIFYMRFTAVAFWCFNFQWPPNFSAFISCFSWCLWI